MHLDDERVQRLLHDELGSTEAETRLHLEGCALCRDLVEGARAEEDRIHALLSEVDHPVATLDPRVILIERKASGGQWARRAAAAVLGVAIAGAAYALPGSPMPAALDRLFGTGPVSRDRVAENQAERPAAPSAGIAVAATDGLVVELEAEGQAVIELVDDEEVAVRAMSGTATFDSESGRLTVRGSGPVQLEIRIPRTAKGVEVLAGSRPVFRMLAAGPASPTSPDSAGRYTVPLKPPRH